MPPMSALVSDKRKETSGLPWGRTIRRQKGTHTELDKLLRDDVSKFERDLIIECREIGMSDEEIKKWLQEI